MPFGLTKSGKDTKEEEPGTAAGRKGAEAPSKNDGATADSPMEDPPNNGDQERDPSRMSFRPDFLDTEAPEQATATAAPPTPRPRGDVFFVSVAKDGGAEVHRFEDPTETQTFVEQLLEQGVPPEEVTAYSGFKLDFKVRHRPVVRLISE